MNCLRVRPGHLLVQWVVFLALSAFVACPLFGQVSGGTLSGTVTDTSGALIPNAQIIIKDVSTGVTRTVTSDAAGLYTAPNLLPGGYEVSVSAPGFATAVQSGITLTVGAQQVLNFTMQVGQVTNKIEVTTQAPAVHLADSTISAVVNSTTVRELPLNGRDWTQLATLQPGVNSVASEQASTTSAQRGTRGYGVQMAISGARPSQNSYRIDGINVNDAEGGAPASVSGASLGADAIQEFSVLMSNYSAEYGRTSGGVINAITRSGTNQFHGDAYEFLRNSALDAANFFDNFNNRKEPPFKRNQFGASAGGPIRKDRTFVFGDYEGFRQDLGVTTTDTVPSLDARNGIIHNANGTTTNITVDPLVKPFLGLWALPNGAIQTGGNTAIFSFAGSQVLTQNYLTARIDHKISDKDSLFGSWQSDKSNLALPDALDDSFFLNATHRVFSALEETHIFTPQLVNSIRAGFNRSEAENAYTGGAINPVSADLSLGAIPGIGPPAITVSGLTGYPGGLNAQSRNQWLMNTFQGYDDLFLNKGIHSMKFGFAVERDQQKQFNPSNPGGVYTFGSLTNFLTNKPSKFNTNFPGSFTLVYWRQTMLGGYFQDDIRWRRNLTVNLGLRYEMVTVPTEVHGEMSGLRNPASDSTPHLGAPIYANPSLRNFQPRIGFAWDPFRNGKTSIRGGFGIFDVLPLITQTTHSVRASAPFTLSGSASNLPAGSFPAGALPLLKAANVLAIGSIEANPHRDYVMQWNFNLERQFTPSLTATLAYVGSHNVHATFYISDFNMVIPTPTSAGYLWPCGLPLNINGNCTTGHGTVINPKIGRINYEDWSASPNYNALQMQITKRMSHGFQAQGSYTWGKSIDEGDPGATADAFQNSLLSELWVDHSVARGVSDFNISQNLTVNYTWTVPTPQSFHGPAAWVAGGWQVGGILTVQTGLPFTPLMGSGADPLGMKAVDAFDYPDRLTGPGCQTGVNPGNVNDYIKLSCLGLPTAPASLAAVCTPFAPGGLPKPVVPGTCTNLLGNAGRNSLVGPGLAELDFSLFKNNPIRRISENFNVQFRMEFFNILNRANFSSPLDNDQIFDVTGAPVPSAGLIDGTSTTAREIQFALKLIW